MKKIFTFFMTVIMILLGGVTLYMCKNYTVYNLVYIFCFVFIAFYGIFTPSTILSKIVQVIIYALIMAAQIVFNTLVIRTTVYDTPYNLCRILGVCAATIPFIVRANFFHQDIKKYELPSSEEHNTITYEELICNKNEIFRKMEKIKKAGCVLSQIDMTEILYQLPRHSSFHYVNNGTLTDGYFQSAYETVNDGYVYLVVTKSKSLSSDVIGLFTDKEYNHVSLSFDEQLKTIISYNGGRRAIPPGLNAELIENLAARNGSAILVYRLSATEEQKKLMIQKVEKINDEGSAYNLLGLVFKGSGKPNIMFCSQFVYTMLKLADLNYFHKRAAQVTPSDFIELDYGRKLEFVRRISLDEINFESQPVENTEKELIIH